MGKEIIEIVTRICNEKGVAEETVFEAVESAILAASRKKLGGELNISRVEMCRDTGEFAAYAIKEVVETIEDDRFEVSLAEAQEFDPEVEPGDELEFDVTPEDFGRIAAQSAKQIILQRINEAEREMIYERYHTRAGDLVYGTVQRYERGNVFIDLGDAEGMLPYREQPYGERYHHGDRVRAIIAMIQRSNKEPQIILSRRTEELILKLFEQEVPEIADGIVTIRRIAREAGRRTKIAVASSDSSVDPVGACVGVKGSRVQMVVQELRGERIDIVEYSDDPARFVANAFKPAEINDVEITETGTNALLVVRDDQLALAIGRGGLNARLASRLTDVEIDIVSESELAERAEEARQALMELSGVGEQTVDSFMQQGIFSLEDLIEAGVEGLVEVSGVGPVKAQALLEEAEALLERTTEEAAAEDEEGEDMDDTESSEESGDGTVEEGDTDEESEAPEPEEGGDDEDDAEAVTSDAEAGVEDPRNE